VDKILGAYVERLRRLTKEELAGTISLKSKTIFGAEWVNEYIGGNFDRG